MEAKPPEDVSISSTSSENSFWLIDENLDQNGSLEVEKEAEAVVIGENVEEVEIEKLIPDSGTSLSQGSDHQPSSSAMEGAVSNVEEASRIGKESSGANVRQEESFKIKSDAINDENAKMASVGGIGSGSNSSTPSTADRLDLLAKLMQNLQTEQKRNMPNPKGTKPHSNVLSEKAVPTKSRCEEDVIKAKQEKTLKEQPIERKEEEEAKTGMIAQNMVPPSCAPPTPAPMDTIAAVMMQMQQMQQMQMQQMQASMQDAMNKSLETMQSNMQASLCQVSSKVDSFGQKTSEIAKELAEVKADKTNVEAKVAKAEAAKETKATKNESEAKTPKAKSMQEELQEMMKDVIRKELAEVQASKANFPSEVEEERKQGATPNASKGNLADLDLKQAGNVLKEGLQACTITLPGDGRRNTSNYEPSAYSQCHHQDPSVAYFQDDLDKGYKRLQNLLNGCPPSSMPQNLLADFSRIQDLAKYLFDKDTLENISGPEFQDGIRECKETFEEMTNYVMTKKDFLQSYLDLGSEYFGRGDGERLEEVIRGFSPPNFGFKKSKKQNRWKEATEEVFIFYFNFHKRETEEELWILFKDLLNYMKDTKQCRCVMVDLELLPLPKYMTEEESNIKRYKDGECTCGDVKADIDQMGKMDLMRPQIMALKPEKQKPKSRTYFEARCPKSYGGEGQCPKDAKVSWHCLKCHVQLEYGFDGYLYCDCGAVSVSEAAFKCAHPRHGGTYESYPDEAVIKEVCGNLKSFNGQTILVLGETGVGKSTFINAFANYMQFKTMDEAKASKELLSPVKAKFSLLDDDYKRHEVTTGHEDNECYNVGQSSTQVTQVHLFNYKGAEVRIIDTPGIGDTRGIEKDKENFQNILNCISCYDEIHGICILLKPNNSKLTIMFEFCIKELLTHLHKGAAANIVFLFTNVRSTFYTPGDTFPPLEALLKSNNVPVKLDKSTMYCMDNEAFRYLAALKHGLVFKENKDHLYKGSWDKARVETDRLMDYFTRLQPHKVHETISINDMREKILDMTKPLADIAKNIDITIKNLDDKKEAIKLNQGTVDEIRKEIQIKVPVLETRTLSQPRTVCTETTCMTVHSGPNNTQQYQFIQHCHPECYLTNVPLDTFNNPALKSCYAMSGESCRVCGCHWTKHMHVTYENVMVEREGQDEHAQRRYDSFCSALELKLAAVRDYERVIQELEHEKNEILRACAQFGLFLKENSILPYNDAMIGYLNLMIKEETAKAHQSQDYTKVEILETLKTRYQHEIEAIKRAVDAGASDKHVSAQDKDAILKQLFRMKHFGQNLEDIMTGLQRQRRSNSADFENRTNLRAGYVATFKIACKGLFNWLAKKMLGVSLVETIPQPSQITYSQNDGGWSGSRLAPRFGGANGGRVEEGYGDFKKDEGIRSRGRGPRRDQDFNQDRYQHQRGYNRHQGGGGRVKNNSSWNYSYPY